MIDTSCIIFTGTYILTRAVNNLAKSLFFYFHTNSLYLYKRPIVLPPRSMPTQGQMTSHTAEFFAIILGKND